MKYCKKALEKFYHSPLPIACYISLAASAVVCLFGAFQGSSGLSIMVGFPLAALFAFLPLALTLENFLFLFLPLKTGKEESGIKLLELTTLLLGGFLSAIYLGSGIHAVMPADWNQQLENNQRHTPIALDSLPTVILFAVLALAGYIILRYCPRKKLPPLLMVFSMSAMYIGMVLCVLWCVQIWKQSMMFPLTLLPINCVLMSLRTIRLVVREEKQRLEEEPNRQKGKWLARILSHVSAWPVLALVAALPLLGIVTAILVLFCQQPDDLIRAWTQTADWNLSQQTPPPNVRFDEHYLCTVAAGGHKKVVKPLRTGKRHGHEVLVNRQLCIANAFEQLLEERTPRFHRAVRGLYDKTGYPIAKHIRSPYLADAIYFFMKPLEWLFLLVLYLCDANPENRIAVQYPHKPLPKEK